MDVRELSQKQRSNIKEVAIAVSLELAALQLSGMGKGQNDCLRYLWQLVELMKLLGQIPPESFQPGTEESQRALEGELRWMRGTPAQDHQISVLSA